MNANLLDPQQQTVLNNLVHAIVDNPGWLARRGTYFREPYVDNDGRQHSGYACAIGAGLLYAGFTQEQYRLLSDNDNYTVFSEVHGVSYMFARAVEVGFEEWEENEICFDLREACRGADREFKRGYEVGRLFYEKMRDIDRVSESNRL